MVSEKKIETMVKGWTQGNFDRSKLLEDERKLTVLVKSLSGHEAWVSYREEKLEF